MPLEEISAAAPTGKRNVYIAAGVLGLGAITLIAALAMNNKSETRSSKSEGNDKSETAKPDTRSPIPDARPVAVQPGTTNQQPRTGPWPLHDGKEPIADYAKRVGLPATETLDLGGGVKMEFVLVPAGEFMMGDETIPDAKPVHRVRITTPFYLGKYEVTDAQYEKITGKAPNPGNLPNQCAGGILWDEAQAFCTKASAMTAKTVKLPTEAQWEYACRAGTASEFNTGQGEAALERAGWYKANATSIRSAVGTKTPNAWGLYDMHGHAAEWCEDWCGAKYYAVSPLADPKGPDKADDYRGRVLRGGSYLSLLDGCRSASRDNRDPGTKRTSQAGFRVALDVAGNRAAVEPDTRTSKPETGVTDAWIKMVQALPPAEQVQAVMQKLKELNPKFDPEWRKVGERAAKDPAHPKVMDTSFKTDGNKVISLYFQGAEVVDVSPVRGLSSLTKFECGVGWGHGGSLDLAGLKGLPLSVLSVSNTHVKDLEPLKGMPLTELDLRSCGKVRDLSVLAGMPLRSLHCGQTQVRDLSPLQRAPLEMLWCDPDVAAAPANREILGRIGTLTKINNLPIAEFWKKYPDAGTAKQDASEPREIGGYRIVKKLGSGRMGTAYEAEDVNLKRRTFIRVLGDDFVAKPDWVTRFENGTRAWSKLAHPNMATLYNYGPYADRRYIATEFVDGELLSEIIKREKALPWAKALDIAIQLAQGLKHAHDKGVVLRDLKPDAIIVAKDGTPKIVDFFLALDLKVEQPQPGIAVGTPAYCPPEQWRGDRSIDGRADIYALGATFWQMVAGVPLFEASSVKEYAEKHLNAPLPNLRKLKPDLPETLVKAIEKMLAKKPEDRYQNCDELLKVLEGLKQGASGRGDAAPADRPWKPIFDGKTLECIGDRTKDAWRVENGALVNTPGHKDVKFLTKQDFGDGEIRVRFEVADCSSLYIGTYAHPGADSSMRFFFGKAQLNAMVGKAHDLILTRQGTEVRAALDAQAPVALKRSGPATNAAKLIVSVDDGTIRVLSIEYRELAPERLDVGQKDKDGWTCIFNGRDLTGWKVAIPVKVRDNAVQFENSGDIVRKTPARYELKGKLWLEQGMMFVKLRSTLEATQYLSISFRDDGEINVSGTTASGKLKRQAWADFVIRVTDKVVAVHVDGKEAVSITAPAAFGGTVNFYPAMPNKNATFSIKDLWLRELDPDGKPLGVAQERK